MKSLRYIGLLALILLLELFISALPIFRATNLAKYPYRLEQREAAAQAYRLDRSPEKKAEYIHEELLAGRHLFRRQLGQAGVVFSVFLVLDAVWIYRRRRERRAETAA